MRREDIFAAAEAAQFARTESCCGVPLKTCSNDVWKGDIAAFISECERRGGIGWQAAATWLCQHYHEYSNIASLVADMRAADPVRAVAKEKESHE